MRRDPNERTNSILTATDERAREYLAAREEERRWEEEAAARSREIWMAVLFAHLFHHHEGDAR